MAEIKTLNINGSTYTIRDPDAVRIDDVAVGEKAWSGRNIADRLCPSFTESGATVACQPVEGYPLGVVSKITPVQSGSGTPSPDNVRPITGWTGARLTHGNETQTRNISLDFGQTVCGGSLDWGSGVLTVDTALTTIPPEAVRMADGDDMQYTVRSYWDAPASAGGLEGMYCNRLKPVWNMGDHDGQGTTIAIFANGIIRFRDGVSTNQAEAQAWAAENPIQLAYKLAQPYAVQLTPQEVLALSGVNTLYSDTGDTVVTGRADPTAVIEKITNAILALGGNI